MGHESYERRDDLQGFSNRSFGIVFAAFFAIVGLLPLVLGGTVRIWALAIAIAFAVAGLLFPSLLAPLARLWARIGAFLHRVVSPIVLGVMFFLVVTPTGLLMRGFGKDPLRLKFDRTAESYWIPREPPGPAPDSLKNQF
jgi:predicted membrane metal-binding protein